MMVETTTSVLAGRVVACVTVSVASIVSSTVVAAAPVAVESPPSTCTTEYDAGLLCSIRCAISTGRPSVKTLIQEASRRIDRISFEFIVS